MDPKRELISTLRHYRNDKPHLESMVREICQPEMVIFKHDNLWYMSDRMTEILKILNFGRGDDPDRWIDLRPSCIVRKSRPYRLAIFAYNISLPDCTWRYNFHRGVEAYPSKLGQNAFEAKKSPPLAMKLPLPCDLIYKVLSFIPENAIVSELALSDKTRVVAEILDYNLPTYLTLHILHVLKSQDWKVIVEEPELKDYLTKKYSPVEWLLRDLLTVKGIDLDGVDYSYLGKKLIRDLKGSGGCEMKVREICSQLLLRKNVDTWVEKNYAKLMELAFSQ